MPKSPLLRKSSANILLYEANLSYFWNKVKIFHTEFFLVWHHCMYENVGFRACRMVNVGSVISLLGVQGMSRGLLKWGFTTRMKLLVVLKWIRVQDYKKLPYVMFWNYTSYIQHARERRYMNTMQWSNICINHFCNSDSSWIVQYNLCTYTQKPKWVDTNHTPAVVWKTKNNIRLTYIASQIAVESMWTAVNPAKVDISVQFS